MFLFCLFWSVLILNNGGDFIETETNGGTSMGPTPSIQGETTLENRTKTKRKRNVPQNPDQDVEVLALTPDILMATHRFICEFCQKGFKREQNMHLHKRTHKVEYELKPGSSGEIRKKVYVCPEPTCKHHHQSMALGDLTGIKKHYSRKHGEKNWKCEKCSKLYAVESDLKAHSKKCGGSEYKCDCGTIFSRKDSFFVHKYRCIALRQESARITASTLIHPAPPPQIHHQLNQDQYPSSWFSYQAPPPHRHQEPLYSNPNLMWNPVASNPTNLSLELQTVSNFDSLPQPHGHFSAAPLNPHALSFASQMVGHVGPPSSGVGSTQPNTWRFHRGMREVTNFSRMAPNQGNFTYWGPEGEDFGFGAGPSLK